MPAPRPLHAPLGLIYVLHGIAMEKPKSSTKLCVRLFSCVPRMVVVRCACLYQSSLIFIPCPVLLNIGCRPLRSFPRLAGRTKSPCTPMHPGTRGVAGGHASLGGCAQAQNCGAGNHDITTHI